MKEAPSPLSASWPFTGLTPVHLHVSCNRKPRTGFWMWPHEKRERITVLDLLTTLLAFSATRTCLPAMSPHAILVQRHYSCLSVGPVLSLCSSPWDHYQSISPICWVFSKRQISLPSQLVLSCLQSYRGCTLSHCLSPDNDIHHYWPLHWWPEDRCIWRKNCKSIIKSVFYHLPASKEQHLYHIKVQFCTLTAQEEMH